MFTNMRVVFLCLLLTSNHALAFDWKAKEGRLRNLSNQDMQCFLDADHYPITMTVTHPGETCLGDAMGLLNKFVYKVPNRTLWNCSIYNNKIQCDPANAKSSIIMFAAHAKNGSDKYGQMKWSYFRYLMTGNCSVCL